MGKPGWLLLAGSIALSLSACTTNSTPPIMAANGLYQTGYIDGCKTAKARSKLFDQTVVRDDTAYAKEANYKAGWNKGFRDCGSAATLSDPTSEPIPQWQKKGGPLGQ